MSPQDIDRIEWALRIRLPRDYKETVLNFPVRQHLGSDDSPLFDDPGAIIEQNRQYREGFAGMPPWPSHFYFIGDDGAASCYLLDLNQSPSPVFLADHGNIQHISKEADTLNEFVATYIASLKAGGIDPDAERRPLTVTRVAAMVVIVAVASIVVGYVISKVVLGP